MALGRLAARVAWAEDHQVGRQACERAEAQLLRSHVHIGSRDPMGPLVRDPCQWICF